MKSIAMALALLATLAMPSSAETPAEGTYGAQLFDQLHPNDRVLAGDWEQGLAKLIDTLAETSDDPETLENLDDFRALVDHAALPFAISELEGDWQVRSLQAQDLGAFTYSYFPARVYPEGEALVFDKNSGSQRHRGMMAQYDENTAFFVGALYYGYEAPRLYSAMMAGESVTEAQREFDAVAEIYKTGDQTFLMAFAPQNGGYRFYEMRR